MLLFLQLVFSYRVLIKLYDTEQYVTEKKSPLKPILSTREDADKFEIVNDKKDNVIYVINNENENAEKIVWDIADHLINLIYYPYHGGTNQKFEFKDTTMPKNPIQIANEKMCLEYIKPNFEKRECDIMNKNQLFEFIYLDGNGKGGFGANGQKELINENIMLASELERLNNQINPSFGGLNPGNGSMSHKSIFEIAKEHNDNMSGKHSKKLCIDID